MYKILIVEDDSTISTILNNQLCKWGYEAETVSDFNNVMDEFIKYGPQLVILDITLPFYNGFHWCTEIRKISKVPIIFASSASDNMNLIMAINMGADDFIAKPFDLNVVVAKVQALLRRAYSFQGQVNILENKGAVLNLGDMTFTYKDNKIDLSKNEFKILQVLLENKNKAVSRDEIMKQLWESDSFIDDNTLTVNVTRIRKRLENIGLKDFIKTKKGIGYMIGD
ncbi:response regulator transcription factor [Haloimpatiens sp. FM7315]|uniref:response regulator transcription factor n=1 Tax=Haloimpatiens sp. FM7315 TaxID=3298609 RepID=UPI0035A2A263